MNTTTLHQSNLSSFNGHIGFSDKKPAIKEGNSTLFQCFCPIFSNGTKLACSLPSNIEISGEIVPNWKFINENEIGNYIVIRNDFKQAFQKFIKKTFDYWKDYSVVIEWRKIKNPECIELTIVAEEKSYDEIMERIRDFENQTWMERLTTSGQILLDIACE